MLTHDRHQRAGEGRLARPRSAGQADGVTGAGQGVGEPTDLAGGLTATLDQGEKSGQGRPVTGAGGLDELGGIASCGQG